MKIQSAKISGSGWMLNNSVWISENALLYPSLQEWIAAGNSVEPEFTQADLDKQAAEAAGNVVADQTRATPELKNFLQAGPAGIESYINTNVTDMASAKAVLNILAKILWVIARHHFKG